ncbi:hypothetical protein [Actinoplanes philippinensis]|uniref:hypothetical protein n=1 Tax=Actinoplanes philippinensis TaxID=35752 RepID=UPI00340D12E7
MRIVPRKIVVRPVPTAAPDCADCRSTSLSAHLNALMDPISRGSRDAFVTLFDHTRGAVRAGIDSRLREPQAAAAIFAATYVEVWWLAGCHTGHDEDVLTWIDRIAERRSAEAGPHPNPPAPSGEPASADVADPQHLRAALELSSLLGRSVDPLTRIDLGRC